MHIRHARSSQAAVLALVALLPWPAVARADDIAVVKGRLYTRFLEEGAHAQQTIQGYLDTIQPNGSWADINYADDSRNVWPPADHLYRVEAMAKAYRTIGHFHYNSPAARTACSNGLDYWYSRDPRSDNWWWNEIGTQLTLMKSLVLLESDLTAAQITSGCTILNRAQTNRTGQNLVWAAKSHVVKGLLQNNASTVTWALGLIASTIIVTTSEGVQPDWSFQQHGPCLYSGGYGAGFSYDTAFFASLIGGTQFAFAPDKLDIISSHLLDGQRWMVRGRIFDYGVHGRGITRKDMTAWEIVSPSRWMAGMGTARQAEFTALHQQLTLATPPTQPAVTGNRHFWHSDYMTHSRPAWFMSTRMFSTRNYNTDDYINGEGKRSHHIADGCTFILLDGEEYYNIFGAWDWYRIPGATIETNTSLDPNNVQFFGTRSFVGGVSDGTYGLAAFDFARGTLNAKKAWFYFDNEAVCLGAAITSGTANPVYTSVNQCLLAGSVQVKDAQGTRTLADGNRALAGLEWAHHDNVGYVFPTAPTVQLENETQTGTWNYINEVYPAAEIDNKNVFSLWLDHGGNFSNGSYQYLVVPGISATALATYSENLSVVVLSNTGSIQAVQHPGLGIIQAAFHSAGTVAGTDGLSVAVDQPCLVMLRRITALPAQTEISVSNPRNQSLNVNADINRELSGAGAVWMPGSGITRIAFSLASGNDAGRSVVRVFEEAPFDGAAVVGSTIPDTLLTSQVLSVAVTLRNTGNTVWTRDAGYMLGAVDDSDPFTSNRKLLAVGEQILPGQEKAFTFVLSAPATPGAHITDWRMLVEGVHGFGEAYTKSVQVQRLIGGDLDDDNDVDQCDFGMMQPCLSRLITSMDEPCARADLNRDTIVDVLDVAVFASCMGGPGQPPACAP